MSKRVSIAIGWDEKAKPQTLGVASNASELLSVFKNPPKGIQEVAIYRDPIAFKRRRYGTPPVRIVIGQAPAKSSTPAAPAPESKKPNPPAAPAAKQPATKTK